MRPSDVPTCDDFLKLQVSGPPAALPHSGTKLRSRIGDIVRHSVEKVTPWGRVVQLSPRNLASCCQRLKSFAALSDRQGLMIGDRLEFGACDLELVCILFLVSWDFQV